MAKTDNIDISSLGVKVGIEIHQQLDTTKLFCPCPSILREEQPDSEIKRKLHAVAGETGKIDVAAKQEIEKNRVQIYETYDQHNCLVELDEEPPHEINQQALQTALQVSMMLNATPVDEMQVMRKTVVDGSNTSGFQRTGLLAENGLLITEEGEVRITSICIEEEAARKIKEDKNSITWRLDRLGIPLIEIGTAADIKTPKQAKETAEKIGMFLRSTRKVKRGQGTIRQDVNVSIKEGTRVEIKGAQDLQLIPKLVTYEAYRQKKLLDVKKILEKRNLGEGNAFLEATPDIKNITKLFKNTESKVIKKALEKKGVVYAVKIVKFAGLLGEELLPNYRIGKELSEHAKIKAGAGGIFHSDELPKYGITEEQVAQITKELACEKEDAFILVADQKNRAEQALTTAFKRAQACMHSLQGEVRKANADGTTSYLRPLPGAARMYPETDVKTIKIDTSKIKTPELISDRAKRYEEEWSVKSSISTILAKSKDSEFFEELVEKYQEVEPAFIAETLINSRKEMKSRLKIDPSTITHKQLDTVFNHLNRGMISKEAVFEVLVEIGKGKSIKVIQEYELLSEVELEKVLMEIVEANKEHNFNAIIGKAMSKLRGKAPGKKIIAVLKDVHKKIVG